MKIHITNLYGTVDVNRFAPIQDTAAVGLSLGFHEMAIYCYPAAEEEDGRLTARLDGIISALEPNDTVFLQLPTGNGLRFERALLSRIKAYPGVKVVLWLHSFADPTYSDRTALISLLNRSDFLILSSSKLYRSLKLEGLTEIPYSLQEAYDDPSLVSVSDFLLQEVGEQEAEGGFTTLFQNTGITRGYLLDGFGLLYPGICGLGAEAADLFLPYPLPFYVSLGIPVVAIRGSEWEPFVRKWEIGFTVRQPEETRRRIEELDEYDKKRMEDNARCLHFLLKSSYFTRKVIWEAVEGIEKTRLFHPSCAVEREEASQEARKDVRVAEAVHICFGLHDRNGDYTWQVSAAMQSLMQNSFAKICFHLLHDDTLRDDYRERLKKQVKKSGAEICFHFVDQTLFREASALFSRYTVGALFRLLIPDLLVDLPKVIYLDADIVCCRDIVDFWRTDINGFALAGVEDPYPPHLFINGKGKRILERGSTYVNSGVLLMNLQEIREMGSLLDAFLDFIRENQKDRLPDQNFLNWYFAGKIKVVEKEWDYFSNIYRQDLVPLEGRLFHYAADVLQLSTPTALDLYYRDVVWNTPFARSTLLPKYDRLSELDASKLDHLQKLTASVFDPSIRKIYYGQDNRSMQSLKQFLPPAEGDLCLHENATPTELIRLLEEGGNRKNLIFILADEQYPELEKRLRERGLRAGEDYFNLLLLMSSRQGGYA